VYSERLLASWRYNLFADGSRVRCPADSEHQPFTRRALEKFQCAQVDVEVSHSKRDEPVIWTTPFPRCLVHSSFAADMRSQGFTGFRLRPATVRFRDGFLSRDYKRLEVTGWGGLAHPSSGIRLVRSCTGCDLREYSGLKNPKRLVDVKQWAGDDFFIVWPLEWRIVVTGRVAEYFQSAKVRSCEIRPLAAPPSARELGRWESGCSVGSLAGVFPKALAVKYRRPPEIV
jgi:hypothetical protein